jgi:hypothetical protein
MTETEVSDDDGCERVQSEMSVRRMDRAELAGMMGTGEVVAQ